MEGLARVGSGFAFSTVVQGHQVTAVGEVPAQTVEFIAALGQIVPPPPHSAPSVDRCALRAVLAPRLRPMRGDAGRARRRSGRPGLSARCASTSTQTRPRGCATGTRFPVLLFAGELVCHGHLDAEEVLERPARSSTIRRPV